MADGNQHVVEHYTIHQHLDQLLEGLASIGKDIEHLSIDDLASFDAFHLRGRTATEQLAQLANLQPQHELLDVGCGIGGACRYLAGTFGCQVIGIDLTPDFCHVAEQLTQRTGLSDRVTFHCGSALELPFDDEGFDFVWTEHAQMNIADKPGLYQQITRVLKPQGVLLFHDILAGDGSDLTFPVPWAPNPSISHLIPVDELWMLLTELGFDLEIWEDVSEPARQFVVDALEKMNDASPPLHARPPMNDAKTKLTNLLDALSNDRVRVVQAVCRKLT